MIQEWSANTDVRKMRPTLAISFVRVLLIAFGMLSVQPCKRRQQALLIDWDHISSLWIGCILDP